MDVLKDLNDLEEIKEQLDIFIENNPPSDVNVDRVSINTCDGKNGKFAYNYIKNKASYGGRTRGLRLRRTSLFQLS